MRNARIRLFLRRRCDITDQRTVLHDAAIFDAAAESINEMYDQHCMAAGTLTDFLDWLLANSDAIMALIKKIIDLFS